MIPTPVVFALSIAASTAFETTTIPIFCPPSSFAETGVSNVVWTNVSSAEGFSAPGRFIVNLMRICFDRKHGISVAINTAIDLSLIT